MSPEEGAVQIAVFGNMLAMGVQTLFLISLIYIIYRSIGRYLYKRKLKKIDLSKYQVLGTRKGVPYIFQNKNDPNDLIFI